MTNGFTPEQIAKLSAKLDVKHVAQRTQAGRSFNYIEGWHAIAEANRILGFDAWSSETAEMRLVAEKQRTIGRDKREGWGVSYVAKVRVTVVVGSSMIIREGMGSGHGIDVDLGLAHESALKEAETDARKRALMTFGNPFGLALYDRSGGNVGRNVDDSLPEESAEDFDPETGEVLPEPPPAQAPAPSNEAAKRNYAAPPPPPADQDTFPGDRPAKSTKPSHIPEDQRNRPRPQQQPRRAGTQYMTSRPETWKDRERETKSKETAEKLLNGNQTFRGLRQMFKDLRDNPGDASRIAEEFQHWKEIMNQLRYNLKVDEDREAVQRGFEVLTDALKEINSKLEAAA